MLTRNNSRLAPCQQPVCPEVDQALRGSSGRPRLRASTSSLSRAPGQGSRACARPPRQHPEYKGYQRQVRRTCPALHTTAPPRRPSRSGTLTLDVTAARQRETRKNGVARRRRRLRGARGPGQGPGRRCPTRSGGANRRVRDCPWLQMPRPGSGSPKLSTVPSSSSSGAAAWSCSRPGGLFRARGAPHGQGPGSASGWVQGAAAGADSTSRAPSRFVPSGQGLPANGQARRARPRPQLRAPGLQRGGGAGTHRPGQAPSAAARGGAAAGRGALSPRACAARPRLRGKEAPERASPRPGARGRGRGARGGAAGRSRERRRGERIAVRWVRGAEAGGPRRRERSPASAAAASEMRRLPGAPGARSWAAAAAATGSRAPLAGAGARSPPPAPGQEGAAERGPTGAGAGVRASGWPRRLRVPRAPDSLSSCSDCVSVSCLCSRGGPRAGAGFRAGAGPAPSSAPASDPVTERPTNGRLRSRADRKFAPAQAPPPRRDSAPVLLQLAGRQAEATPGAGIPGRVGMKGCKLGAPRPSSPPPRPLPAASGLACLGERGGREAGRARSCRVRDARRLAGPCSLLPKLHKTAVVRSRKFPRLG